MLNQSVDLDLHNNETNNGGNDRLVSTGPDSPYFKLIHITAVVMCVVSVTASTCTLVYLRRKEKEAFYKWKIGQRMVFYLAIVDLIFSLPHPVDHIYAIFQIKASFEELCVFFAVTMQTSGLAQSILVSILAISALLSVYFNKKIRFGKYDWILLLTMYGIPTAIGIAMLSFDLFGPSGYWCHADIRKETGLIVHTVCSACVVACFLANLLGYIGVWVAVWSSSKRLNKYQNQRESRKYNKTARILVLFVLAYLSQWSFYVVYTVWSYVGEPHWILVEVVIITVNAGGILNSVVYTLVRRNGHEKRLPEQEIRKAKTVKTISPSDPT